MCVCRPAGFNTAVNTMNSNSSIQVSEEEKKKILEEEGKQLQQLKVRHIGGPSTGVGHIGGPSSGVGHIGGLALRWLLGWSQPLGGIYLCPSHWVVSTGEKGADGGLCLGTRGGEQQLKGVVESWGLRVQN